LTRDLAQVYTLCVKKIVQFSISKGEASYTAEGVGLPIFTQGVTLDELVVNMQDATKLYFKGEDIYEYGFDAHPSVLINFEMPR